MRNYLLAKIILPALMACGSLAATANVELPITTESSGVRTVPCDVNGLTLRLSLAAAGDTVEARVSAFDAEFMLRNGYFKPSDISGGVVRPGARIRLRKLTLGSRTVKDIVATVSDTLSVPLQIGQMTLPRFGTSTIYGDRFVMVDGKKPKPRRVDARRDMGKYFDIDGREAKPGFTGEGMREYNGAVYKGRFTKGVLQGKGSLTYASGDVYEGDFVNDLPEGDGLFAWMNGDRYSGSFKAGRKHGKGILVYADSARFEGEWVDDERHGFGMIIWTDGERYEGDFSHGKRSGHGRFLWNNGDEYDGDWVDNRREGSGILKSREGGWTYEGDFVRGRRHGTGKVVWESKEIYKGEFQNDQRTGRGIYWLANGDRYEGDFVDGYFYGHGTYFYENGDSFEGEWIDDERHGRGKYRFADGSWFTGTWAEDGLVTKHEEGR